MRTPKFGSAAFILVTLISGAAVADFLPPPDPVPPGLEGPCRGSLEARHHELENEKVFLEPQISFHEDMCAAVDTDDQAAMNECLRSENDLSPQIDAYFKILGPYQIEIGAIRTRLADILPERQQIDAEIGQKRTQVSDLEVRFAHHGDEINRALTRLSGGTDRIAEWKSMTIEAQKKALKDAFFVVADHILGRMKIENKAASAQTQKQLDLVSLLVVKHGAVPNYTVNQLRRAEKLVTLSNEKAVLTGIKLLKESYKVSEMSTADLEKTTLAVIDLIRMVSPPHLKVAIGGSKFGASYLYAIGATIMAEGNIDLESEQMAIHLRAISANQGMREHIMQERNGLLREIAALEQKRADIPSSCPEFS